MTGNNGRGSFGDVLLALAGGMLASDAAKARGQVAEQATVEHAGGKFVLKAGQIWDYGDGDIMPPSRIDRLTTQCVEYTCLMAGCRGHEVPVIDFVADLIKLGGKLRESDNERHHTRGVDAPHPAVATAEKKSDTAETAAAAQAEDPIAETLTILRKVQGTIASHSPHTYIVDSERFDMLARSVSRLCAGKVQKPATLHQPSAAASRNDFATATEAAEPAPADPITQAMALIPRTYVEDENNICAAISNMVSHIDRLKRSVERLTGHDAVNRVCESCRAAVKAAMGKGDIPGVVKTNQS